MSMDSGRTTKVTWRSAAQKAEWTEIAEECGLSLADYLKESAAQRRKKNPPNRDKRPRIQSDREFVKSIVLEILAESGASALRPEKDGETVTEGKI